MGKILERKTTKPHKTRIKLRFGIFLVSKKGNKKKRPVSESQIRGKIYEKALA